jgi:hypothetical protein
VAAGGVTVETTTRVDVMPIQEQADEYLTLPLHGDAYAGIVAGLGAGDGVGVGVVNEEP